MVGDSVNVSNSVVEPVEPQATFFWVRSHDFCFGLSSLGFVSDYFRKKFSKLKTVTGSFSK
jgi:hypothetical protein